MRSREYYTIDRGPQEIGDLWNWAANECAGKLEHENPYAMGVLACMEYLMGETQQRPQDYKGVFRLKNVLRQFEKAQEVRRIGDSRFNEPGNAKPISLFPGNPKTLLYEAPVFSGDVVSGGEGALNECNDIIGSKPDDRSCES